MFINIRLKHIIYTAVFLILFSFFIISYNYANNIKSASTDGNDFIKWVDFNASYEALSDAMSMDIETHTSNNPHSWIDILSYLSIQNGNNFSHYTNKDIKKLKEKLKDGKTIDELMAENKYYNYYKEVYTAVLGQYIGNYNVEIETSDNPDEQNWESKYGLKAFSPIAKNYYFEHYSDFANARTYGYKRKHTGHDLFGSIGTPVIAIEGGIVEYAGWNQYGGWRIGIRSFDKKRYYYYAHLRKDHPYSSIIEEGATIQAGDVIGYLGMTGYSTKENVNNINVPHLHLGIQLIFDESQKDGNTEIWIDSYNIVKLLQKNKSAVYKDELTKEYFRKFKIYEK